MVIARYDGFVARYVGDGILTYFGPPSTKKMASERCGLRWKFIECAGAPSLLKLTRAQSNAIVSALTGGKALPGVPLGADPDRDRRRAAVCRKLDLLLPA
jgi:hypothetical protein